MGIRPGMNGIMLMVAIPFVILVVSLIRLAVLLRKTKITDDNEDKIQKKVYLLTREIIVCLVVIGVLGLLYWLAIVFSKDSPSILDQLSHRK